MFKRIIALTICFCFVFEQTGIAQVAPQFVMPAYLSNLSPVADRFRPVQLRSIEFDPSNDNAQLLLDKGDNKNLNQGQIETASRKLFEYFQIGLALPNSMFWVNLRPDAPDNIIDPYLEKTDLGKVLLEADLQLKKDLARFTNPDTAEGRQYWDKLYAKAEQIFGLEDMEIPTITRPWIVPGEIIMRSSENGAFIYKATLKVMLEQDYLKDSTSFNLSDPRQKEINGYSSQLIRDLIIPKLTKEVNSSKRYAELRQVYYSLVLAQWYKQKNVIARSGATKQSTSFSTQIDSRDLAGLTSKTVWSKDSYYQAYRRSFQNGEYKREEQVKTSGGLTIRQYFSGGMVLNSSKLDGGSSVTVIQSKDLYPIGNLERAGAFLRMTLSSAGAAAGPAGKDATSLANPDDVPVTGLDGPAAKGDDYIFELGAKDGGMSSLLKVYETRKSALIDEYKRKLGWDLELGLEQQADPSFETDPEKFLLKWQKAMQDLAALQDGFLKAYQYKIWGDPLINPQEEQIQPVQETKSPLLGRILSRLPGVSLAVVLLFGFGIISGVIAHVTAAPLDEQFLIQAQFQPYVLGMNNDAVYPLSFHGSDELFGPLGLRAALTDPKDAESLLEKGGEWQDSVSSKLMIETLVKLDISKEELSKILAAYTTATEKKHRDIVLEKSNIYPQNESVLIFVDPSVVNIKDGIAADLLRELRQNGNSVLIYISNNLAADQMQEDILKKLDQRPVDKVIFWDKSELSTGSDKIHPKPDLEPVKDQKARIKELVDRYDGDYIKDKKEFDDLMNKAVNQNITRDEGTRMHELDRKISLIGWQLYRFSSLINEKADNGELYDYLIEGNNIDELFPDIYEQIDRIGAGHRSLLPGKIYTITPKVSQEKQAPKIFTPLQVNQSSFDTFQRVMELKAQLARARADYEKKYEGRTFEQDYEKARTLLNVAEEKGKEDTIFLNELQNNLIFRRGEGKDIYAIWQKQAELDYLGYENLFLIQTQEGNILTREDVERIYNDYRAYSDYVVGQYQDPAVVRMLIWIYFIDPELANGIRDKEVMITFTDDYIVLLPLPGFNPVGQAIPPLIAGPDGEIRLRPVYQTLVDNPVIGTMAHEIFHNIRQQDGIPQLLSYTANPLPEENQARIRGDEDEMVMSNLPWDLKMYYSAKMTDLDMDHVAFLYKRIQSIDRQEIRNGIAPDLDPHTKVDYLLVTWGPTAIFISAVGLGMLWLKRGLQPSPYELMSRFKQISKAMEQPELIVEKEYRADGGAAKQDGGTEQKDVAGIDLRALPLAGQSSTVPAIMPQLRQIATDSKITDLDKEWLGIQKEMQAGDVPYARMREYMAVCLNRNGCRKHLDKVADCIINILRIEEEQALPTRNELKDLLICIG